MQICKTNFIHRTLKIKNHIHLPICSIVTDMGPRMPVCSCDNPILWHSFTNLSMAISEATGQLCSSSKLWLQLAKHSLLGGWEALLNGSNVSFVHPWWNSGQCHKDGALFIDNRVCFKMSLTLVVSSMAKSLVSSLDHKTGSKISYWTQRSTINAIPNKWK